MNKFKIIVSAITMLLSNILLGSETEKEALVVVIYPHFFNNTRTLYSKLDSLVNRNHSDEEFFIYFSNELNPSTYFERDLLFDLFDKLSYSYGNLVPNYSFDLENINKNERYLNLINNEKFSTISYAFFIPSDFWEFLFVNNNRKNLNVLSYKFGIIPKKILEQGKEVIVNVYFPKDTSPENISEFDDLLSNFYEL